MALNHRDPPRMWARWGECPGPTAMWSRPRSPGVVGKPLMDDYPRLDRPGELIGPHADGEGGSQHPGRLAGTVDTGFAARLGVGGGLSPSMLRYPGPRDHCGFEAPAL